MRKFGLTERIAAQWKLLGAASFASKLLGLGRRAVNGLIFRLQLERENKLAEEN